MNRRNAPCKHRLYEHAKASKGDRPLSRFQWYGQFRLSRWDAPYDSDCNACVKERHADTLKVPVKEQVRAKKQS